MRPLLIVRLNPDAPDLKIDNKSSLPTQENELMQLISDSKSSYFIDDDYLLRRLLNCIDLALNTLPEVDFCPVIFDSWSCWNTTPPYTTQYTSCPQFDNFGFTSDRMASKFCGDGGVWWIHPETNRFIFRKTFTHHDHRSASF